MGTWTKFVWFFSKRGGFWIIFLSFNCKGRNHPNEKPEWCQFPIGKYVILRFDQFSLCKEGAALLWLCRRVSFYGLFPELLLAVTKNGWASVLADVIHRVALAGPVSSWCHSPIFFHWNIINRWTLRRHGCWLSVSKDLYRSRTLKNKVFNSFEIYPKEFCFDVCYITQKESIDLIFRVQNSLKI